MNFGLKNLLRAAHNVTRTLFSSKALRVDERVKGYNLCKACGRDEVLLIQSVK